MLTKLKGYRTYIAVAGFVLVGIAQTLLGLSPEETTQAHETATQVGSQLEQILSLGQLIFGGATAWFLRSGLKDTEKRLKGF